MTHSVEDDDRMPSVQDFDVCPRCGNKLQSGVLRGRCPRCMLEMGSAKFEEGDQIHDADETYEDVEVRPLDRGRFIAGTVLSRRYRIVGLLGRGGMGEVYKAEDLTLRQLVALKFLPAALSSDGAMLARFHREVRTARHVTHSNVCRVYDIGEALIDGRPVHFLSMEYIDGEDLAVLLRRIGHLPHEKSIELARQLCAGLTAAHEAGMVHRDLKPANIMLDGRGRARIMDFGLSDFAEELRAGEVSGTPAYMAPEQLRGRPATTASDIYALGLVLYEVFTGHRPFESNNVRDLIGEQERRIRPPSSRTGEINPLVERVILRCLAAKADQRPPSAFDVAAALPGGDPLAAALAAGETPSPEMVAASGRKIGLSPPVAGFLLAGILSVLLATAWLFNPAEERSAALANPPEALAYAARGIMSQLGFREPPVYTAHGFTLADDFLAWAVDPNLVGLSKAHLAHERPGWIRFWYRESSEIMAPAFLHTIGPLYAVPASRVTDKDPPAIRPDMRNIVLDSQGRLLEFRAVPSMVAARDSFPFDWTPVLLLAGLNPQTLIPARAEDAPATGADQQQAWTGTWPGRPDLPLRVEAATWQGQPVFFKLFGPWSDSSQVRKPVGLEVLTAITISVVVFGMLTCALLARRNIRAGRGDREGGLRIALYAFSTVMLAWFFGSDHTLDPRELNLYLSALAESLYWCAIAGIAYLALEPVVRHRWPHALISWNRVLKGRFKDPLVGRDVLIGIGLAAVLSLSRTAGLLMDLSPPQLPEPSVLQALHSNSHALSFLLAIAFDSANVPLGLFLLFWMFRFRLRNEWIAALVWVCLVNAFVNLPDPQLSGVIIVTLFAVLWLLGVLQFGLVTGMAMWFADRVFRAEIMIPPNDWYGERIYLLLGSVALLSVFAFATSVRKHESW
jgi:hypothetical protein